MQASVNQLLEELSSGTIINITEKYLSPEVFLDNPFEFMNSLIMEADRSGKTHKLNLLVEKTSGYFPQQEHAQAFQLAIFFRLNNDEFADALNILVDRKYFSQWAVSSYISAVLGEELLDSERSAEELKLIRRFCHTGIIDQRDRIFSLQDDDIKVDPLATLPETLLRLVGQIEDYADDCDEVAKGKRLIKLIHHEINFYRKTID